MSTVIAGDQAPNFTLPKSGGGAASLGDYRGKSVILYFYPKDDTSGCTVEAREFSALHGAFTDSSAVVMGVSPDTVSSHDRFAAKYDLPFTLLADTDHAVAEQYGVWVQKSMYGKKYMGIDRTTFLIGPDAVIQRIWTKVKPAAHAQEVLSAVSDAAERSA